MTKQHWYALVTLTSRQLLKQQTGRLDMALEAFDAGLKAGDPKTVERARKVIVTLSHRMHVLCDAIEAGMARYCAGDVA